MLRVLRLTLMWLLALAVPVQGFAAASMIGCGTSHHGAAGMHSHAVGMHQHEVGASQHSHGGDEDEMALGGHQQHAADVSHGDDHSSHGGQTKFTKSSCSACASCCTSAALPSAPMVFQPADAPSVFVLLASQRVVSFVSGGLE